MADIKLSAPTAPKLKLLPNMPIILENRVEGLEDEIANLKEQIDSGNVNFTETDPTVPEWVKQPQKPTYTADEVGALSADTEIPSLEGLATQMYVDNAVADKITIPESAEIGQTIAVKEIDEEGKPKSWETINLPGWTLIGECETTEEVSGVEIKSDIVFDEIIAFVSVPPIPEDTGGTTYVRPVLKNQNTPNANVGLTKPHNNSQIELWHINRMWGTRQYWKSNNDGVIGSVTGLSQGVLSKIRDDFDNGGGLVGFSIYWNLGNKFPAGVKMRVWGR